MLFVRVATVLALFFALAPLQAGLVETHFPGKSEAEVASEFEAGLPAFLTGRLNDPGIVVRAYAPVAKNVEVYVQLKSVNGSNAVWVTLVNTGWIKEKCEYALAPLGKEYTLEIAKLPAAEVANWFPAKGRTPAEVVACACWLASKGELWLANGCIAGLAAVKTDTKKEIDEWVASKHGWSVPAGGLESLPIHDLKHNEDGVLLVTAGGKTAWLKELDEKAKEGFKALEKLQGNDVKSKPGQRKNAPGARLEWLQKYVERFQLAYAGTATLKKRAKDLEAIADAIKADIAWVDTEKYKAERKGIEKDWPGAAKHYEEVLRADPLNPELLYQTAEALNKAAVITDGARKAEDPAAAKRSALLFEQLIEIYPTALGYRNYAGVGWLASGDKNKAREHHEEVMRRTVGEELTDNEKQNREFAEGQLKLIK